VTEYNIATVHPPFQ